MEEPSTSKPRGAADAHRPMVVYVMGAGRSGSTILGVTLGNCTDVFYAGELDKWLLRSGKPARDGAERARFWSEVRDEVDVPSELLGGRARCLERSSALFHPSQWAMRRSLRNRYRRVARDLYLAVARTASATHVVDTSHYPLRAHELQSLDGFELYLVFLVRDPQSVVASFDRRDVPEPRFGVLRANAYLWLTYLLSTFVFLQQPHERRLLVRYDDFAAHPEVVLRKVLDRLGSDASIPDLTSLTSGMPLQGNRLIRSDVISFERKTAPARRHSLVTGTLQWPWRVVFSRLRPVADASA